MAWTLPEPYERLLWEAAARRLPARVLERKLLHHAIVERSKRYTSERETLHAGGADTEADLAARALFFTPADAPKIMVPLAELARESVLPAAGARLRLLDLGAGAGAMSLGVVASGHFDSVVVTAVDRDRPALGLFEEVASELRAQLSVNVTLSSRVADVTGLSSGAEKLASAAPWDLIAIGTMLNELSAEARQQVIQLALSFLAPGGALIAIEPALRETARSLHALRDHVLESGLAHVFAPCTGRGAPCPALEDERDWCHEDRPVELPPRARELSRATGLRDGGAKFAYVVLRREPSPAGVAPGLRAWRVVSQPRRLKGITRDCFVCGEPGRVRLRLLKRERSEANRPLERARRGDVLLFEGDDVRADTDVELRSVEESR